MELNYKNKKHLQEFAKALILVKWQILVKKEHIILLEAGCNEREEIDYLLFKLGDIEYRYSNGKVEILI